MLRESMPLREVMDIAKGIGFDAIHLTPHDDLIPYWKSPRASKARIDQVKRDIAESGIAVASVVSSYAWSSPDEPERHAAVRYWKRAVEVTAAIGVDRFASKLQGDPQRGAQCEDAFWRSLEEVLPVIEREGVRVAFEAHPGDFIEDGYAAVDLIQNIDHPLISYILCAPHTFSLLGGPLQCGVPGAEIRSADVADLIRHSAAVTTEVHIADSQNPARIVVNPPGAPVRVHQHLDIGLGDLDWDTYLGTLYEAGFDGIFTIQIFSHPERIVESYAANLVELKHRLVRAGYAL